MPSTELWFSWPLFSVALDEATRVYACVFPWEIKSVYSETCL